MQVTREQIQQARRADLYNFLILNYRDKVIKEGNCLRLKDNHSLVIKSGWSGWKDHSNGLKGNGIDLLVNAFGMAFPDAVMLLLGAGSSGVIHEEEVWIF